MGKKKQPEPAQASYEPSQTIRYGEVVAKSYKDPKTGIITNEMIETPQEKQDRLASEANLSAINKRLGSIYNPDSADYQSFQKEAQNENDRIRQRFYNDYNPLYKGTRNDIMSRLGTLQSSQTGNILAPLERERAQAEANFAKDLESRPRQIADEMAQRLMSLGGYYQGLNTDVFNKALQNYGTAFSGTQTGNQLSQFNANQINAMRQAQIQADAAKRAALYKAVGDVYSSAVSAAGTAAAAAAASDIKTKENIKLVGDINGVNVYEFEYKPEYNLPKGVHVGVIAQEVEHMPNVVTEIDGIKHVDYTELRRQLGDTLNG